MTLKPFSRWVGSVAKSFPIHFQRTMQVANAAPVEIERCALCQSPMQVQAGSAPHCDICGDGDPYLALLSRHAIEAERQSRTASA